MSASKNHLIDIMNNSPKKFNKGWRESNQTSILETIKEVIEEASPSAYPFVSELTGRLFIF